MSTRGNRIKVIGLLVLICLTLFLFKTYLPWVTITKDYVYCSNWGTYKHANVKVQRLLYNGTLDEVKSADVNPLIGIKVDSSFCFSFFDTRFNKTKIYFNQKNNPGQWRKLCHTDLCTMSDTISKLKNNNWYRLRNILTDVVFEVYVDSFGDVHKFRYRVNKGPW